MENELWDNQANVVESVILGGARMILSCSSRTCKEAVRGKIL